MDKIFLPKATADWIIPQDDTYLSKKILDLQKYRNSDGVDSLFHDYNLEQVNQMQITKQADVLLLMLLFEGLFDKEQKLKNFNYYEPKTTHDSSLSLSTHAILSADLGKLEQSYDFFNKAINIDMGEYMKSSDAGIHAASLGGIWQMIVFGYGGLRMVESQLRIEPHLPKEWKALEYGFDYHGKAIHVELTKDKRSVKRK
ncbi:glycosyl hydrolase family 65 protein [Lactococcus cremoris]